MAGSATTWSMPFLALVRTELWAFFAKSMSTNVSKELATTEGLVLTRSARSNANAHLVSSDHAAKVMSTNVFRILARLLELSTASNLSTTIAAIANRATWAVIANLRSTFARAHRVTMVVCASMVSWDTLASALLGSPARIVIPALNAIPHLVKMVERADPTNKDSFALVRQESAALVAN